LLVVDALGKLEVLSGRTGGRSANHLVFFKERKTLGQFPFSPHVLFSTRGPDQKRKKNRWEQLRVNEQFVRSKMQAATKSHNVAIPSLRNLNEWRMKGKKAGFHRKKKERGGVWC